MSLKFCRDVQKALFFDICYGFFVSEYIFGFVGVESGFLVNFGHFLGIFDPLAGRKGRECG